MSRADGGAFDVFVERAHYDLGGLIQTSGLRSRGGGKLNGGSSCGSRPLSDAS
jgi:hypothetical protein